MNRRRGVPIIEPKIMHESSSRIWIGGIICVLLVTGCKQGASPATASRSGKTLDQAARVLALLGKEASSAAPALETTAASDAPELAAWSAYALWKMDADRYSLEPALPVLMDAIDQPKSGAVNKMSVLADLADAGPVAKPAVESIVRAIQRGDFGSLGVTYLLKIDPHAALQAGLVTGLSAEQLPTIQLQEIGPLQNYYDKPRSSRRREYDAAGNLVLLGLRSANLTPSDLSALSSFDELRVLDLSHNRQLDDQSVAALSRLHNLKSIDLTGCPLITDATLDSLMELPRLKELLLRDTGVTLEGLRRFRQTKSGVVDPKSLDAIRMSGLNSNLRELSLLQCRNVTAASLPVFQAMPKLERLNLGATGFSASARNELRQALPNCKIQF